MTIRQHDARCVWDAKAMLGEGPLWVADEGVLYWVDIVQGRLHRYTPTRSESCLLASPLTALALTHRGEILCTGHRHLHVFDRKTSRIARVQNLAVGTEATRINDGCCHADGSFWFGTMDLNEDAPLGDFYRFTPGGECERVAAGFAITNGPAFSPDGRVGYFVDTTQRRILRASMIDGRIAESFTVFAEIPESDGHPDGPTVDADGGVWCAHFGGGRVTRFDANGRVTDVVRLLVSNVTKCAFGGERLDRLFITTARKGLDAGMLAAQPLAGGLFEADVGYRGVAPPPYRGEPRVEGASGTCFFETS
jgi:sugar lactone lactonase YvrE